MKETGLLEIPGLAGEQVVAEVAVPLPVAGTFSYVIPETIKDPVEPGMRVRVPFRNRDITGYVVEVKKIPANSKLKNVSEVLDREPAFSRKILELTKWIADAYGSGWGESIENALPKWVKYGKKADKALAKEKPRAAAEELPAENLKLTADQQNAFGVITASFGQKSPKPVLIYGVTGSGKSEIYIRIIQEAVKRGQSAICMVPEIALTEQLRHFFIRHFGNELEILHSKLTDSERFLAWKRIERGNTKVVLGPRSAVFAPLPELGLIIMDEEHEGSYKQDTTPRYHAREAAVWRASNENAVFVMGSATPSLESMFACEQGRYVKVELSSRVDERAMPQVSVIDLKNVPPVNKKLPLLSPKLVSEIQLNLQKKQGTMLLLNRRGFSTHIHCLKCGYIESCKSCQVSLTFHQEDDVMLCHYCNYQKPVGTACSECGTPVMKFAGFGTEKVESEVAAKFPQARIARMDADSVKKRGSHEEILGSFRRQEIDILIGTQMIAKGFDFPHVTLVGVVLADVGLSLPDFRSAERTFQLMTQVAGRAGRGKLPGRVVIQTYSPQHPSIQCAKDHDYMRFFKHESGERLEYHYPPYYRLINIIIRSKTESKAYAFGRTLREALQAEIAKENFPGLELIGPAPLPFYKLRGHFRWHVMLKIPAKLELAVNLRQVLFALKKPSDVAFALDVDPLNIL